jgi:hypothetical protein
VGIGGHDHITLAVEQVERRYRACAWRDRLSIAEVSTMEGIELRLERLLSRNARTALTFCEPLMQHETIIFFDDWNTRGLADQASARSGPSTSSSPTTPNSTPHRSRPTHPLPPCSASPDAPDRTTEGPALTDGGITIP